MAIRFADDEVRPMGRAAVGVRGVSLYENDHVVSMEVVEDPSSLVLSVSEHGYGKRTPVADYPQQGRGGKGVITMKTTERNGRVAAVIQVAQKDQVMVTTNRGTLIRMRAGDVSEYGRNTQGVRVIAVDTGESVVSVSRIAEDDDDDDGAPTAPDDGGAAD
jgi:DNA gyrase subunit A